MPENASLEVKIPPPFQINNIDVYPFFMPMTLVDHWIVCYMTQGCHLWNRWSCWIQEKTGIPKLSFMKCVPICLLSIASAVTRTIEQWPAVVEYFTFFVPN